MLDIICSISLILTIWFRSNAWIEYTRLLKLNCLSKYKEYDAAFRKDPTLEYHTFLKVYYSGFIIRLITCPICCSVWLGLLFGVFTHIILFPIYSILGLLLFLSINKLLE